MTGDPAPEQPGRVADPGGDEQGGEGGPGQVPCDQLRPHLGPHPWQEWRTLRAPVGDRGAVVITGRICPGVPGVSAEFIDRQEVTVVRCYGGDDLGAQCKRMLVFDGGPGVADTDMHGWTVREQYAGGVGDRVWACGVHS